MIKRSFLKSDVNRSDEINTMNPFSGIASPADPASVHRPTPTPFHERRRDVRRPMLTRAMLTVLDGLGANDVHEITTRDLSGSGICFLLKIGLSVGQHCRIDLTTPAGKAVTHSCEIVRSRPLSNGKFEMGVQFIRTPVNAPPSDRTKFSK